MTEQIKIHCASRREKGIQEHLRKPKTGSSFNSWQKAVIGGVPLKRKPILLVIVDILLGPSKAVTNAI